MAAPNPSSLASPTPNLQAPKLDLFTQEQLKQYDGTGSDGTIYVAVKGEYVYQKLIRNTELCRIGTVFDVT